MTEPRPHLVIHVYKPRDSNYTPENLIIDWAKENRRPYSRTHHGRLFITLYGLPYVFDHWEILPLNSITERINLSLTQISAWDI